MNHDAFLVNFLWASRLNPLIRNRSKRSRWLIPALYVGAAAWLWNSRVELSWILLGFGLVWIVIYPFYENFAYRRHYNKRIRQNYGHKSNWTFQIGIQESKLFFSDGESDSLVPFSEIESAWENEYAGVLFKLKTGHTFLLPRPESQEDKHFNEQIKEWLTSYGIELSVFDKPIPGIKKL